MGESTKLVAAVLLVTFAVFLGAIQNAIVKVIGPHYPSVIIVFTQYAFCFFFLIPLIIRSKGEVLKTSHFRLIAIRSLAGLFYFWGMFIGVHYISLMDVSLLSNTGPLFAPLLVLLFFRQRFNIQLWLGLIIGFIGVVIILRPGHDVFSFGGLVSLWSGFSMAVAIVSLGELAKQEKPQTVLVYYFLLVSLVLLPLVIWHWQMPAPSLLGLLVLNAILMLFHQGALIKGLSLGAQSKLAVLFYSGVVFSALLGWWFWQEIPTILNVIGASIIFIGATLVILLGKQVSKRTHHICKKYS